MTPFPETLRRWRRTRRLSQLELALEARVSARHISFLETGRARPSADMVVRLSEALALPLAARNQLLGHAGFAPRHAARSWDEDEMAPVRAAVQHMLDRHMPYPALAIDRLWTVMRLNPAAAALFGPLGVGAGDSLLDLMLSDTLPAIVENWPTVAHHAALRLRTESAAAGGVPELDRAAARLGGVPHGGTDVAGPVIPAILRLGGRRLALFATIAQFGTPDDLTLADSKIEFYFPADAASAAFLAELAA